MVALHTAKAICLTANVLVVISVNLLLSLHHQCRLYDELTGVNDEIGDLEDRLAALKDKADSLGKKYVQAKKDSEKADKEVQVNSSFCSLLMLSAA